MLLKVVLMQIFTVFSTHSHVYVHRRGCHYGEPQHSVLATLVSSEYLCESLISDVMVHALSLSTNLLIMLRSIIALITDFPQLSRVTFDPFWIYR